MLAQSLPLSWPEKRVTTVTSVIVPDLLRLYVSLGRSGRRHECHGLSRGGSIATAKSSVTSDTTVRKSDICDGSDQAASDTTKRRKPPKNGRCDTCDRNDRSNSSEIFDSL